MTPLTGLLLDSAVATDVGLRRQVNEDSALAEHPVYAVADGMGGHEAGDRASQAVVAALRALLALPHPTGDDVALALDDAQRAVAAIADTTSRGAGSTVSGAVALDWEGRPHWLVVNVGDSRVYRVRQDRLEQLTIDHSLAQELVDRGRLAQDEVATFGRKNVITRAVGADDSPPDYSLYPIVTGDVLVACSDGLTGEVDDAGILSIVLAGGGARAIADALVAAALAGGGRDNVTVVVVAVEAGGIDPELDDDTAVVPSAGDAADAIEDNTLEVPRR